MTSSSPRSAIDTIRDLYAAFGQRDLDRLRQVLHPNVEWIQCPGFPGGDHRHGAEQVIEKVLGGLNSVWEGFEVQVDEYLDAGNEVVVLGAYEGKHGETLRSMRAVFAHVYEVSAGRVTRFRQYTDTWPMVAAIRDLDEGA